jgi:hypothetical protein
MKNTTRRRLAAVSAALAALASVAAVAPADDATCRLLDVNGTPDDTADDVELCESTGFVVRATSPLGNLGGVEPSLVPGLSADEPTLPVPAAAAGGSITDILLQNDPSHGLEFSGEVTGPIDDIGIVAYVAMPNAAAFGGHGVTVNASLDGSSIAFGGGHVEAVVEQTDDPGIAEVRVALSGIYALMEAFELDTSAEAVHTLRVNLSPFFFGDDGAYLFDAVTTPTRVEINPSLGRLDAFAPAN